MKGRPPTWLPRPALEHRLDAALTHRLTTLVGAPGYGKSALLERWGGAVNAVGHRLSPDDHRLVHLVGRVTQALRLRATDLPGELSDVLAAPLGPDAAGEADARAAALAGTLAQALHGSLRRHLVLVLDDVDVLEPESPSARFLDALLRSAPHRLHVVTASRRPPPFPVARLRDQGQVLELTAADLTLDRDEVRDWTARLLDDRATQLSGHVLELTGGWPLAVVTTLRQLAEVAPTDRSAWLETAAPTPAVEELLVHLHGDQPPPVREVLLLATVVPVVTSGLAVALGHDPELLVEIHHRGTFLDTDGTDLSSFRLTPTARAALAPHLEARGEAAASLAGEAAEWYAGHGRVDLALRTLLQSGTDEALTHLLTVHGDELTEADTADDLLAAVERLPSSVVDTTPALRRLEGVAHQLRGDWERAHDVLTDVAAGPAFDAEVGWRLGLVHHLRGNLDDALAIYERGAAAGSPAPDAAICSAWAAAALWLRGDRDGCARHADDALARATELDDPRALAAAHMVMAMLAALDGDRRANDAHYLRAIDHAERAGDVLQLIRIRSNRASHHLEEGAYEDALAELEVARRLADMTGFTPFTALTLSNRAEALVGVGRLEEATADATDAVAAWRSLGSRLVVYGLEERARVQRLRGDRTGATATFREALASAETTHDVQGLVPMLARLAELVVDEDPDEARELVDRALAQGEGMGYAAACIAAARVAIATNRPVDARRHLEAGTVTATDRRDRPALAEIAELQAQLTGDRSYVDEAIARWREIGDTIGLAGAELTRAELSDDAATAAGIAETVERTLHAVGCRLYDERIQALRAEVTGGTGEEWPTVRIQTLGGFRVLRDGTPIPRTAWQSRKARDLLKLLASRRGRPTPRDWLIEHLWPDADPDKAAKRLNVMTSTVRGILDPDRVWDGEHILSSDRDTLQLDLRHVELDVDRFLEHVDEAARLERLGRGDEALARWSDAERLYVGEFCEDDVYEDWAVAIREEARAAYGQTIDRLAAAATRDGRDDEAVRLWLRLLERDPYDERAHLALVSALLAGARTGDARRRYLTYVGKVRELGVEPAPFPAT